MATETPIYDTVFVADIVGDLSIPCDYSENEWCGQAPAEWVLLILCPGCGYHAPRLAGSDCHALFLTAGHCIVCPRCEHIAEPREFIHSIEPITRKGF